jgi:hypothetical protein
VALARAGGARLHRAAYTVLLTPCCLHRAAYTVLPYTGAVPISPFRVTSAASSSAASPPVPAGRDGSTM